ncbi:MAG: S-layer homology domain-containing protein, partial [Armatimonadota bacterium]
MNRRFASLVCSLIAVALLGMLAGPAAAVANERAICVTADSQQLPAIYGHHIVWAESGNGGSTGSDIYMKDLFTGVETAICTATGDQDNPAIFGDRIVWEDNRNGNWDIYMYDLATATESAICTDGAMQRYPGIWGDRIVYEDWRNGNGDIYICDLAAASESAICTNSAYQGYPAIWGDRIAWLDIRNGNSDIYMHKLAMCSFDDVPRGHAMWPGVEAIYAQSVTSGTSSAPPLYSPANNTTRGQMAVFLCNAFGKTWYDPGSASFTDVPRGTNGVWDGGGGGGLDVDGTHIFYGYIERLADAASWGGTAPTGGYGDGTYRPANTCTRGQMATFLCIAAGKTWYDPGSASFTDVPRGTNGVWDGGGGGGLDVDGTHIFYGWIERLADVASWASGEAPTGGYGD